MTKWIRQRYKSKSVRTVLSPGLWPTPRAPPFEFDQHALARNRNKELSWKLYGHLNSQA